MIIGILVLLSIVVTLIAVPFDTAVPICFLIVLVGAIVFLGTSAILQFNIEKTYEDTTDIIAIEEVYSDKGYIRVVYTDNEYRYHDDKIYGSYKLYDNEDTTDNCDYLITRRVKWKNRAWYWLGYPMNDIEHIFIRGQANE